MDRWIDRWIDRMDRCKYIPLRISTRNKVVPAILQALKLKRAVAQNFVDSWKCSGRLLQHFAVLLCSFRKNRNRWIAEQKHVYQITISPPVGSPPTKTNLSQSYHPPDHPKNIPTEVGVSLDQPGSTWLPSPVSASLAVTLTAVAAAPSDPGPTAKRWSLVSWSRERAESQESPGHPRGQNWGTNGPTEICVYYIGDWYIYIL